MTMVKVFTPNKAGKIEFTKEELDDIMQYLLGIIKRVDKRYKEVSAILRKVGITGIFTERDEQFVGNIDRVLDQLDQIEPRVLTLEETLHRLKEPVFLETKSRQSYTGWVLVYDVQKGMGITGVRMGLTQPGHITTWYPIDLYGSKWRCWSAKPTDEQRKAVKWDD